MYRTHVGKLCRIAYNQVRDEAIAEGIVHKVFSSLWERRKTLHIEGAVENYLVRAVKLAVMDHIRTQVAHRKHIEHIAYARVECINGTEDTLMFRELQGRVNHLVERLSPQCKKVYRLSRERGMSIKEIAAALQLAEKTVEAHLSKALKFLRTHLADYQYLTIFLYFFLF